MTQQERFEAVERLEELLASLEAKVFFEEATADAN